MIKKVFIGIVIIICIYLFIIGNDLNNPLSNEPEFTYSYSSFIYEDDYVIWAKLGVCLECDPYHPIKGEEIQFNIQVSSKEDFDEYASTGDYSKISAIRSNGGDDSDDYKEFMDITEYIDTNLRPPTEEEYNYKYFTEKEFTKLINDLDMPEVVNDRGVTIEMKNVQ